MNDTLMWEARAEPGRRDDLLRWIEETALPRLAATAGFQDATVYLGGQERVVVIAHYADEAGRLPDPPDGLVARPAAQWPFQRHHSV
jgi:hypothetical protein